MNIIFRDFKRDEPRTAPPGELHLRPIDPQCDAALACAAVENGLKGFVGGSSEAKVQTVVLRKDATFDDMLALLVLQELLDGHNL